MRVFWYLLGLFPLLGPSGVHADIRATLSSPECTLQAWVRAPDLAPGTIIQGDARLKLTAGCTVVESASLGLRFKERSFVKAQPGSVRDVFVNVEAMYEYFVRVAFANGTRVETPVGFMAFHLLYDPPRNGVMRSKTTTVQLQTTESLDGSPVDNDPVANYTAEVSTRGSFTFSQGAVDQSVWVTVTRTGRARTFVEPLNLYLRIDSTLSPKWALEHTSDPTLQSLHKPNQILRATSADFKTPTYPSISRRNQGYTRNSTPFSIPDATADQIAAAAVVATTSEPVYFFISADPRHATDFETYYHAISSALFLSLDVPRTQDEPPNLEHLLELRAMRKKTPEVGADEEAWVPWSNVPEVAHLRADRTYTGNISVSVYPADEELPYCMMPPRMREPTGAESEQVVVTGNSDSQSDRHRDSAGCAFRSPVHYLAKGARVPTFVDGGATQVQALLAKTPAERDTFAPFLEPVVSSPPAGEERVHRYYRIPQGHRPLIYVGETWVKKVAHIDDHKVTASSPDLIPGAALVQMAAALRHMIDEL